MSLENITYPLTMTHRRTNITSKPFDNPHIRQIIDRIIRRVTASGIELFNEPLICDPFANESFTAGLENCITNDLNPKFNTDYNLEFADFAVKMFGQNQEFDLILFDPPYSLRQLKEQYDGIGKDLELWQTHNMWSAGKDLLAECVKHGGYVISLGWHSSGFGKKRGFQKTEVHLFEQVAREDRYDLILTIEKKVQTKLALQFEEIVK
tara:strand:+ start:392 stop:1015 length:624 start_codon:yes stop_codon:yes gene_type:complete